jgi:hypothetical protein
MVASTVLIELSDEMECEGGTAVVYSVYYIRTPKLVRSYVCMQYEGLNASKQPNSHFANQFLSASLGTFACQSLL